MSAAQLGVAGYLLTALAFLALGVYLRPASMRWNSPEFRVRLACFGTVIWAVACAVHAQQDAFTVTALQLFDAAQLGLWLSVLSILAVLQDQKPWLRRALVAVPATVVLLSAVAATFSMAPSADDVLSGWVSLLVLLQALLGILAIEQLYRNATAATQQPLRWMMLGIGLMVIANLFQQAEAIAIQNFDQTVWHARSLAFVLAAPAIYKGLRGIGPDWKIGLFVSRQIVFYSTSFVLIGVYLVLMSLGGALLRDRAGSWGVAAQTIFVITLGAILLVLIFSVSIRRRLMVFVATHFYRNRYDYRIEWLRFVQTLSSRQAQDNLQESAIRAVCQIVHSEAGRMWLIDETGKRFQHAADWSGGATLPSASQGLASDVPLLEFMRRSGWVVDLDELQRQPELYDKAEAPGDLLVLGSDAIVAPLLHVDSLYGVLLLRRPPDLATLHFEDRDLLKMVGRHLAAHLWQADIDRRLTLSRQFEAYNRMTAFVMHDLKNLTAQLQLVVTNAARHKRNPEFVDDAIATIDNSVERMSKLLATLAQDVRGSGVRAVALADLARRVALRAGTRQPVPRVDVRQDSTVAADPEQLAMVLDHVLRNSQDATAAAAAGDVVVEVDIEGQQPCLRVRDNGAGMDAAFIRDRLFKPFDTTKGTRGMGIGAYQAREYLRSLGGDVRVESAPGEGTVFTMVFPQ